MFVVTGMFGPVLLFLLVFISTSTARTGPSLTPDLKTWCYGCFRGLSGLLRCRIYIMLYSCCVFMHHLLPITTQISFGNIDEELSINCFKLPGR